jgi:hypothetical protein
MDRTEKASDLVERAEQLELRLEFDSGTIPVKRGESGNPERQDAIMCEEKQSQAAKVCGADKSKGPELF